ncbi:MAG: hypothetical protein ACI9O4_000502 [Chitinophagales bacterium]|jgi:hypothetical protein
MRLLQWSLTFCLFIGTQFTAQAQESIAQTWTEQLLFGIRNDFARPTVHARNLFHSSVAMHDAWAAYNGESSFYFLGQNHGGLLIDFEGVPKESDTLAAQHEAICYAVFRIMDHRFQNSPGASNTIPRINAFMDSLNYNRAFTSVDYLNDGPAALGNYIASKIIEYGYLDGSNELNDYANIYYTPSQPSIEVEFPGNPDMTNPNRWQPIALSYAVDQAGNILTSNPPFLSPEWGDVTSFAIPASAESTFMRNGDTYKVYHDPGPPVYLDTSIQTQLESLYKWNFTMVSVWQSHLDPNDTTSWDISPASIGNIPNYPNSFTNYDSFYNYYDGGDSGQGYALNPKTNMPYTPQLVKRADYARVLAEFWADGLDSETPPGHWFNIYNEVRQHPLFENKWKGLGPELSNLEYDVKSYLTMGGAMHDAAISAWSIKGWYDYVRPVSAIRYMAEKGQSTIDTLSNYHPAGLPLDPGFIEIVELGDSLAGASNQHLGKVKLYTWKGPGYITNPDSSFAGVGWILAEEWWPYQRPSFVTPPFAGYLSGHSTFSRAAADVMTFITGDPYFPGGMSSFSALENEFLEFEQGPSTDVVLEWATYKDASDQCSLSRIWGGIHPPTDDIKGRLIGAIIGSDVADKADSIFSNPIVKVDAIIASMPYANITAFGQSLKLTVSFSKDMNMSIIPNVELSGNPNPLNASLSLIGEAWLNPRTFEISYLINTTSETINPVLIQVQNGESLSGVKQLPFAQNDLFFIDSERPTIVNVNPSQALINDSIVAANVFYLDIDYSEDCDTSANPTVQFVTPGVLNNALFEEANSSYWLNANTFRIGYSLVDTDEEISNVEIAVSGISDLAQNQQLVDTTSAFFNIVTASSGVLNFSWSDSLLNRSDIGSMALILDIEFDENMDTLSALTPLFSQNGVFPGILSLNQNQSSWIDSSTIHLEFDLLNQEFQDDWLDISLFPYKNLAGNPIANYMYNDALLIDTKRPDIRGVEANTTIVSDSETGAGGFLLSLEFDEAMNTNQEVITELFYNGVLSDEINFKVFQSSWLNDSIYQSYFEVEDNNVELQGHQLQVNFGEDLAKNSQELLVLNDFTNLDTRNPEIISLTANKYSLTSADSQWELSAVFDEQMDTTKGMKLSFVNASGVSNLLTVNVGLSSWLNETVYNLVYDINPGFFDQEQVAVIPILGTDTAQNEIKESIFDSFVSFKFDAVSIQDVTLDITLYPNPVQAGSLLDFKIGTANLDLNVNLFNELGQIMSTQQLRINGFGQGQIEIPNHLEGVYIVEFVSDKIFTQKKVIISQ